jgi:diketogulonate reductase-like aldo/keto reductase
MPILGLGVFQTPAAQTAEAIRIGIQNGYRLIDTAAAYGNERQVGEGIKTSGIDRSRIFVTTKLWITDYGYERTLHAFDVSMRKLGFDYLDLYLLHWPVPSEFETTIASYKAAEKLVRDGRVRAIGVSNFSNRHLQNLMQQTSIIPAVNQVELHPFYTQLSIRKADAQRGIVTQSWSPIGGIYVRNPGATQDSSTPPLSHPTILQLATKYNKTAAQIILRWHLDHGLSPIPKSVHAGRIAENIDVFDFSLNGEEIAAIDRLDTGRRAGTDPETASANSFNVTIPDE